MTKKSTTKNKKDNKVNPKPIEDDSLDGLEGIEVDPHLSDDPDFPSELDAEQDFPLADQQPDEDFEASIDSDEEEAEAETKYTVRASTTSVTRCHTNGACVRCDSDIYEPAPSCSCRCHDIA